MSARHAARRHPNPYRPGRPALHLVQGGRARHAAARSRRTGRGRHTRATLDRYDRLLLEMAGWLFSLRIALLGERPIQQP